MSKTIELILPMPPTDNRYYGKPKGKRHKYLTKAARIFRHEVAVIAMEQKVRFGSKKVAVKVRLHFASGGDIWNRLKGLGDALQYAGIIDDDRQIEISTIIRGPRVKGGRCEVTIWEL